MTENGARILACAALAAALAAPGDRARAQQPPARDYRSEIEAMTRSLSGALRPLAERDREMLERVRGMLRNSAPPSAPWRATLERIKLDVPLVDFWDAESGAMAFAGRERAGVKPVTIGQLMAFSVHDKSALAARRMATHLAGVPDNHPKDMLLALEAQNIEWHAMAWIAAHEIAHHRLGHTARNPASLAQSRTWELEADRLGFDMLNDAGFSVYVLSWYFETMAALESARRRYRLDRTPEHSARHPLWRSRYDRLQSRMRSLRPPRQPWLVLSTFKRYEKGTPLAKQTYLIPHDLDASAVATVALVSRGPSTRPQMIPGIGGFERDASGAATIYLRGNAERIACRIADRFSATTNASCRLHSRPRLASPAIFFRDSFAGVMAGDTSRDVARLFNLGGPQTARDILARTVPDADMRAAALRIVDRQYRGQQRLILRFTRGDISEQQFGRGMSALANDGPRELRALLGTARYAAYERRVKEHYEDAMRRALGQ